MISKVLKVFYGADNLPYKDKERTIHFPIVGNAFMGASNTTEIWFYFERIGEPNNTWVAIAKLPNGKIGSVKLDTYTDTELNEPYAKLQLNTWFTQLKGDLYISLNGYDGGITLSLDQETGLYSVVGTPTIQATGSVKLSIQYATRIVGGDEIDEITLQEIYAMFGDKLDTNKGIVVISNPQVDISEYDEDQYFYSKSDNSIYENVSGTLTLRFTAYSKSESDTLLATKVDKLTTSGVKAYIHNGNVQGELAVSTPAIGDTIAKRESDGRLKVATPTNSGDATTKDYVDTQVDTRVAKTTNGYKIYGTDELGNQVLLPYDEDTDGKVVRRDESGHIYVQNPNANGQATPKQYVDNNFAKTLDMSIDSNYDLVVKLLNANGVVISQDDIDLPLESIVVSATYYDTYTYEGTTYEKVLVIVLATTDVPTIVPVGDLVSGLQEKLTAGANINISNSNVIKVVNDPSFQELRVDNTLYQLYVESISNDVAGISYVSGDLTSDIRIYQGVPEIDNASDSYKLSFRVGTQDIDIETRDLVNETTETISLLATFKNNINLLASDSDIADIMGE